MADQALTIHTIDEILSDSFVLTEGDQLVITAKGGIIMGPDSAGFHGIFSYKANDSITIDGTVRGYSSGIVLMNDGPIIDPHEFNKEEMFHHSVKVGKTGWVSGRVYGMSLVDISTVVNEGTIKGYEEAGIAADYLTLTNSGTIEGLYTGINCYGSTGKLNLTNLAGGAIRSFDQVGGDYYSTVMGSNSNDTVRNHGRIEGKFSLSLENGNDRYDGRGGIVTGKVNLGAGNDVAIGGAGREKFYGGSGRDVLKGGKGNDFLSGGLGMDRFVFDTAPNAKTNVDTIADFKVKEDKIYLAGSIFTKPAKTGTLASHFFRVGEKALDSNDHFIYNPETGELSYDKNGSEKGGAVVFAHLAKHLALSASNLVLF